ncbi:MAG: hypothetical protein IKP21_04710, partial [Bacteroidales bacterium]|nr:hypothetical protein [Bacteroidales bacterium]
FLAAPVYRRTRKITVALPDSYAGHEVHLYGMIVNEEGEWSETIYAGCVVSEECGVRSEEFSEEFSEEGGMRNEELGAVKSYELGVKSGELDVVRGQLVRGST